jgi:hypothetical protein
MKTKKSKSKAAKTLPCEHIRRCDYVACGDTIRRFCMTVPIRNNKTFDFQIPNDWVECPVCLAKRVAGGDDFYKPTHDRKST